MKNAGVNLRFQCQRKSPVALYTQTPCGLSKCQSNVTVGFICHCTRPISPQKPLPLGGDRLKWASRPCPKPRLHYLHGLQLKLSLPPSLWGKIQRQKERTSLRASYRKQALDRQRGWLSSHHTSTGTGEGASQGQRLTDDLELCLRASSAVSLTPFSPIFP